MLAPPCSAQRHRRRLRQLALSLQRRPLRQPGDRQLHLLRRQHLRQCGGGSPAVGTFRNDGALIKQGADGSSSINAGITSRTWEPGPWRCPRARSRSAGAGRSPPPAPVQVAAGATLDFGGGTFAVSAGITGTGSGSSVSPAHRRSRAAPTRWPGRHPSSRARSATTAPPPRAPDTIETGGTLSGTGTLNVSGQTTWSGGAMAGTGVTNANGG